MMDCMENIRALYKNIGDTWCPNLGEFITFNADGLRHLVRKRGILRSGSDQKRRFALLQHAKAIIQDVQSTVMPGKEIGDAARFWVISKPVKGKKISVVVRQFKGKSKHFFSIYSEKQKSPI
jgi:hypothetical protein